MKQQTDSRAAYRTHLLKSAAELASVLQPMSQGLDKVLKRLRTTKDVESIQDHVASLRIAELFHAYPNVRFVFEEPWAGDASVRLHDLVVYVDSMRVVNEVRRIQQDSRGAAAFSKAARGKFAELPNRLSDLIALIREKRVQLEPGAVNILWLVSRNILFGKEDVRDARCFETKGHLLRPADQTEPTYSKLPDLVALGWLFDGDRVSNSCTPHCFLMSPQPQLESILGRIGICMGFDCLDCTAGRRSTTPCCV